VNPATAPPARCASYPTHALRRCRCTVEVGVLDGVEFASHQEKLKWLEARPAVNPRRFEVKGLGGVRDAYVKLLADRQGCRTRSTVGGERSTWKITASGWARCRRAALGGGVQVPPEEVETQVEKIDVQVGRTGGLTPVAFSRLCSWRGDRLGATLHNEDEIARKDVREATGCFCGARAT